MRNTFYEEANKANSIQELAELRDSYFGRKRGLLTLLMKQLRDVTPDNRAEIGKELNELKLELESALERMKGQLEVQVLNDRLASEQVDVTLPGNRRLLGHAHPLSQVGNEIEDIFYSMGYSIEDGPEIETPYYNFEALNIPEHHPARDAQDTFYVSDSLLLRTHTSPVQIRTMETRRPPLRIICPGRVFRHDNPDATHSPVFHQVEGLAVDEGITFADLKGTLEYFLKAFFSERTKVRFRPSYFAFTEPSAEVDISCFVCSGKGCRICKMSGWIEVLGAGMVNPAVFNYVHYDPERYTGFAFGIGIERFAMVKYSISNIQHFYESDLRFLEQF
ncbi:MAG: phenylalanine--tRNA ligase subunit alpha [Acidobacteria bacterium]|nr:MAG: phenylalanine--tRNA ligase subunit alpha [Acidobacteriota bacterium]